MIKSIPLTLFTAYSLATNCLPFVNCQLKSSIVADLLCQGEGMVGTLESTKTLCTRRKASIGTSARDTNGCSLVCSIQGARRGNLTEPSEEGYPISGTVEDCRRNTPRVFLDKCGGITLRGTFGDAGTAAEAPFPAAHSREPLVVPFPWLGRTTWKEEARNGPEEGRLGSILRKWLG